MLTDITIITLLVIYAGQGWTSGLLSTLIGPASVFVCSFIAFLYFDLTDNMLVAFFIAVAGSILTAGVASMLFYLWRKGVEKQYRNSVFPGSRPAGAVVSLVWLGGLTIAGFMFLALIPTQLEFIQKAQGGIRKSHLGAWTERHVFSQVPLIHNLFSVLSIFQDHERLTSMAETPEFKDFLAEEKLKDCINDPEVSEHFENKNIAALLGHPKVAAVLSDGKIMKKLTRVARRIYSKENEKPAERKESDQPTSQYKTPQKSDPADPDRPAGP